MARAFYIVSNYKRGNVNEPIIIYEDGSLEIKSVIEFKKNSCFKGHYDAIHDNMKELGIMENDLSARFSQKSEHYYFWEILFEKIRPKFEKENINTITYDELLAFWYEDLIRQSIYAINSIVKKKINNRETRAVGKNDIEFLKKMGSEKISWVHIDNNVPQD